MNEAFHKEVLNALSDSGELSQSIPGFYQRDEQIQFAAAVAKAISSKENLVAEAATGTGKTFAYLVPALLSNERTIVSTGTKHLQDQLFFGDLPAILLALGLKKKTAYLKGRSNYLCHYRINLYTEEGHFHSKEIHDDLSVIKKNLKKLVRGDKNELPGIKEDSLVWPYATSTPDNCIGSECDFFQDCFVQKARKKALGAELLVINHHLFFADNILREDGFAEILPEAKLVVFDEAHQLNDVAINFFGERISTRKLKLLINDLENEVIEHARDMSLKDDLLAFERAISDFNDSLPAEGRYFWKAIISDPKVRKSFAGLLENGTLLLEQLCLAKERSLGLKQCYDRLDQCCGNLSQFLKPETEGIALWAIVYRNSFVLLSSPIDVSKLFPKLLSVGQTNYVFTSATLSVAGSLAHFKNELGLERSLEEIIPSPFNSKEKSILYFPRAMPDLKQDGYIRALLDGVRDVLAKLNGRTLFLFTSFRALNQAADIIDEWGEYKILRQGDRSKSELIAEFRQDPNAKVLLATSSFWEGVDIKGPALSMVVIDKLPFESPYEPLVAAKINLINEGGGQAFYDYQIPKAIISLKQGVGRLLRDKADRGVVVIGDGRIYARRYGHLFLESLPPMKKTRCLKTVLEFTQEFAE